MSPAPLARLAVVVAIVARCAFAQPAPSLAFEERLKRLEADLRCLVCQNQTLADSNAPLAEDLRREVRALAVSGKSDDEIRAFLVARYGDFVLYRPPVKGTTWILWFGPFALLATGAIAWLTVVRRRRSVADSPETAPSVDAVARAREAIDAPRDGS
ncbi:MAG: cytochrome c-type biogenesis protein [Betaproteobacteria bacterium]